MTNKEKAKKLLELAQQLIKLVEAELDDDAVADRKPLVPAAPVANKGLVNPVAGVTPLTFKMRVAKFDVGDIVQVTDYSDDMYSESFTIRARWYNEAAKSWAYDGDLGGFKEYALTLINRGA